MIAKLRSFYKTERRIRFCHLFVKALLCLF